MQRTNFQIVPLATEIAEAARASARAGAPDHETLMADQPGAFPCRHCLRWAEPGERMVLFPYASIPEGRPYSESGPIFVHEKACARYDRTDEYPAEFRQHRVLRAYNQSNDMIDAVILGETEPEKVIMELFENSAASFLQARSATRGCYTFAISRA
ncbi:MAG TPA: DUF1203 domain-containing protein [Chthoniobacterales bacterium]